MQAPKIFFATYLEQITITRAMRVFDQIGGCLGTSSLALVVRGTNGRNDVFCATFGPTDPGTRKAFH